MRTERLIPHHLPAPVGRIPQKFKAHDINDLKKLIRLAINWVENVELTEQYDTDIQHGGSERPEAEAPGS